MTESAANRSIRIEDSALGSAIVSGDGNTIYVIHQAQDTQPEAEPAATTKSLGPNPYKGLAAFKERDADRYFGREAQVERLWQRFQDLMASNREHAPPRLLPILGPSGCGKSSLARAGLIPELAQRPIPGKEHLRVAVLVPSNHPVEALAGVLAKVATQDPIPVTKTREFAQELRLPTEAGDYDGLRRIADLMPQITDSPLVVLVDQFEEVYSLCKDLTERQIFIENLLNAATDPTGNLSVILTLRSDFLGETQRHQRLNQVIGSDQSVIVPAMTADELRRAIAAPAQKAGYALDAATVDLLVKDTEGREGALPLLQFALTRIWAGLIEGISPAETYRTMGGVGGALAGKAQEIYDQLTELEQVIARRVFVGLVQLGEGTRDTRRRAAMETLQAKADTPEAIRQVLDRFAAPGVRLVTLSSLAEQDIAEVTHEALFDHWQLLNDWLDSGRDNIRFQRWLERDAQRWGSRGRPKGNSLWRSPDLDLLKKFQAQAASEMTELQLAFYQAAIDLENQERLKKEQTQRQKVRRLTLGISGLAILGILASIFAINAQRERRLALDNEKATQALWLGDQHPNLYPTSALLTVETLNSWTAGDIPVELRQALWQSLELLPKLQASFQGSYKLQRASTSLVYSNKQSIFIPEKSYPLEKIHELNLESGEATEIDLGNPCENNTLPSNRSVIGLNTKTGEFHLVETCDEIQFIRTIKSINGNSITRAGFPRRGIIRAISPNGSNVITSTYTKPFGHEERKQVISIYDLINYEYNEIEIDHENLTIKISSDSNLFFTISKDEGNDIVELRNLKESQIILKVENTNIEKAFFSPDSKKIAIIKSEDSGENILEIWEINSQEKIFEHILSSEWQTASFSPDGKNIAIANRDHSASVWDIQEENEIFRTFYHWEHVNQIRFSPDSKILATQAGSNTHVWSVDKKKEINRIHTDEYADFLFASDNQKLVFQEEQELKFWQIIEAQNTLQHDKYVTNVDFGPNNNIVATASHDFTARLWNINSGEEISRLEHDYIVRHIAFNHDGKIVATAGESGIVKVWDVDSSKLISSN